MKNLADKKTVLMDKQAIKSRIEIIKASKKPFTIKYTTYTVEIICPGLSFHYLFLNRFQSPKLFFANSMIKKNIVDSKLEYPDLTYYDVTFFSHDIVKDMYFENIYNIDLCNAYARVLYNHNFITKKTYEYLLKIPKLDRLASVGMLASQKKIFNFDENGEVVNYEKIKAKDKNGNLTQGVFIFCIKIVGDLMKKISNILGDDFLFFWVDGIYFKESDKIDTVRKLINNSGFDFKEKGIQKFKSNIKENEKINIILWESDLHKCEKKEFNFPKKDSEFGNSLIKYLQTSNLK